MSTTMTLVVGVVEAEATGTYLGEPVAALRRVRAGAADHAWSGVEGAVYLSTPERRPQRWGSAR